MQFDNKQLVRVRNAKGITQAALAESVGVSRVTAAKWENGTATPTIDKLNKMAVALCVPPSLFIREG